MAHDTHPGEAVARSDARAPGGTPGAGSGPGHALGAAIVAGGGLLPAVPLWIWWAVWHGGYPPAVFVPGLLYLTVVAGLLCAWLPRARLSPAGLVALGALAALTAWTWLSITWADDKGMAWLAAERTTLYAVAFALPVLWPPNRRGLVAGVAALAVAAAAAAVAGIVQTLDVPGGFALDGRLDAPARYVNAAAAMLVIGIPPALALATRREWPAPARAVALAIAAGLAGTTILTQSRGAVAGGVAGYLVLLALLPRRLGLLMASAIAAAGVTLAFQPLLDVRLAARAGSPTEVLEGVLPTLGWLVAGTLAAGLVWALVDGRAIPPARVARGMRRTGVVLAVAVAAAGGVAFVSSQGSPTAWAQDRWNDFRTENYGELEASDNRFTGDLGSNRYDYWRVAMLVVRDRPWTGTGAGGFAAPYKAERRTGKGPLYAHSFWMQTLSDLGVPGMAAVVAWLLASLAALGTAFRRAGTAGRALIAMAVTPGTVLLVHGTADWITYFPAIVVPALGLFGAALAGAGRRGSDPGEAPAGVEPPERAAAAAPEGREDGAEATGATGSAGATVPGAGAAAGSLSMASPRRSPLGRISLGVTGLALVCAALAAIPLFLAARLTDRATATWPARPEAALADLELARRLNPLAASIPLNEGVIAVELRAPRRARRAFTIAAERDPSAWYPLLALALLEARDGRQEQAMRLLGEVAERNPREPTLPDLRRAIGDGRAPNVRATQRTVLNGPE